MRGEHPRERDRVVRAETRRAPNRSPRSARSTACPQATPRGTRRAPRAGTARAPPETRRTRRRGGSTPATGSSTAGSRGPCAARADRSRPAKRPRRSRHELIANHVHVGPRHRARHLVPRAVGDRRRRDHLPVANRRAAARPSPPTSTASIPCAPSARSGRPSRTRRAHGRTRRSASRPRRASVAYMPAHPGVIRPMSDTQIISVITSPAPPSARAPRCTRWKSPGVPSTAEYMSIGETTTRLRSSSPRSRSGVNIGGRGSGCTARTNPGSRSRKFSYVTRRDRVSRLNANWSRSWSTYRPIPSNHSSDAWAARCVLSTIGRRSASYGGGRGRPRRRRTTGTPTPATPRPPSRASSPSRSRSARCARRRRAARRCRCTSAGCGRSRS